MQVMQIATSGVLSSLLGPGNCGGTWGIDVTGSWVEEEGCGYEREGGSELGVAGKGKSRKAIWESSPVRILTTPNLDITLICIGSYVTLPIWIPTIFMAAHTDLGWFVDWTKRIHFARK